MFRNDRNVCLSFYVCFAITINGMYKGDFDDNCGPQYVRVKCLFFIAVTHFDIRSLRWSKIGVLYQNFDFLIGSLTK